MVIRQPIMLNCIVCVGLFKRHFSMINSMPVVFSCCVNSYVFWDDHVNFDFMY